MSSPEYYNNQNRFPLFEQLIENIYDELYQEGYFPKVYKHAHCALISRRLKNELNKFEIESEIERHQTEHLIYHDFLTIINKGIKYIVDPTYQQFLKKETSSTYPKYLIVKKESIRSELVKYPEFPVELYDLYEDFTKVDIQKQNEETLKIGSQEEFDRFFKG